MIKSKIPFVGVDAHIDPQENVYLSGVFGGFAAFPQRADVGIGPYGCRMRFNQRFFEED